MILLKKTFLLFISSSFLLAFSCGGVEDSADKKNGPGSSIQKNKDYDMSGNWTIGGRGVRSKCKDSRFDGTFKMGPSNTLNVKYDKDKKLTYGSLDSDFNLRGQHSGSSINFQTKEFAENPFKNDEKIFINLNYQGDLVTTTRVEGDFTGSGPEDCQLRGSFFVDMEKPN